MLTVDEVAQLYRCSPSILNKWRVEGKGPVFIRLGARVRYRLADVMAFLAEPVVAKLAAPAAGAVKPVAGGAVFECLGDVCAARAPASDTAGLRGCKDLVRQVGAVNSFGPTSKPLSARGTTRYELSTMAAR